jgi:chitinase
MRLIITLFLLLHPFASALASGNDIWVTAYYAGWMQGNQWSYHLRPQNIDYTAVTHIVHFSLGPKEDGTLDDEGNGVGAENAAAITSTAHRAGKKVLICVGGWNSEQGFAAATRSGTRERFINNLLALVRGRMYDGVDIDWEPFSPQYHDQYVSFMQDLKRALQAADRNLLLTVATNSSPEVFSRIHGILDQVNLMTYDYAGAWPGWFSWHNAPVYDGGARFPSTGGPPPSIHEHVESFVRAGVPRAKIGIGIDFYGYVWNAGDGTKTGGVTAPQQTWNNPPWVKDNVPYHQIMQSFFKPEYYRWDDSAQAAYLSIDNPGSAEDKFVSYDDERACSAKIAYARDQRLGGVIIWELGGGWNPQASPPDKLLKAVGKALERR